MSKKPNFNEYYAAVGGLTAGEKREAKGVLRFAFKSGLKGTGLANAMVGDEQWPLIPAPSQAILRPYIVSAYRTGAGE